MTLTAGTVKSAIHRAVQDQEGAERCFTFEQVYDQLAPHHQRYPEETRPKLRRHLIRFLRMGVLTARDLGYCVRVWTRGWVPLRCKKCGHTASRHGGVILAEFGSACSEHDWEEAEETK